MLKGVQKEIFHFSLVLVACQSFDCLGEHRLWLIPLGERIYKAVGGKLGESALHYCIGLCQNKLNIHLKLLGNELGAEHPSLDLYVFCFLLKTYLLVCYGVIPFGKEGFARSRTHICAAAPHRCPLWI